MIAGVVSTVAALPADIPSPTVAVWHLGPVPIRAYAMCILAGIVVAVWMTQRRLSAQGEPKGIAIDVAAWAVPFGIVGGRIYHVITTPQPYFGEDGNPWDAFKIHEGGLGIWGAVALGAFGAWLGCRHYGLSFLKFVDAAAPGVAVAQAMGRFGNWFNNEIFGAPTDVPWRLTVYEWDQGLGRALVDSSGEPIVRGYYHPTFLYEALWVLALAAFLIWLRRHRDLAPGQVFAAYVMGYPLGRIVIENMRSDPANVILGQRVNTWVSILVFLGGLWLWFHFARRARRASGEPGPGPDGSGDEAMPRDTAGAGAVDGAPSDAPAGGAETDTARSAGDDAAR